MSKDSMAMLSDTTRHLARKLNKQVSRVRDPSAFPPDLLQPDQAGFEFLQQVGFPESADSVAYEPLQRLLAVGTSDGRVKIIGQHGVEATIRSDSKAPTKYLGFLRHRGALLRIAGDGHVQLFSVAGQRLLSSLRIQGDSINDVAMVPGAPYVMLGCESGDVRVVLVSGRAGVEADGVGGPAASLLLQPYQILGEDLGASGGVVALALCRAGDRPLALVVHRNSGAQVWDVRAERTLCCAVDDEDDPSKPTAACWVGDRANCFAVGYDDGSVLVWGVPPAATKAAALARITAPLECMLVLSLRAAPDGAAAAAVRSLSFVPGGTGTPGGEDCLLVCGGQPATDPDMLCLLPLDQTSTAESRTVPWFGDIIAHALMAAASVALSTSQPPPPESLMVLTAGGQLVVHDLADWQPSPLTLPFQELPPITASTFLPALSTAQVSAAAGPAVPVQHAVTLPKVWECYAKGGRAGQGETSEEGERRAAAWPFTGGEPAAVAAAAAAEGCHPSALLLTGHRDGRVRVWDATAQVPRLMGAVPTAAAAGQERLRPVTTLAACPMSGLLAVGHAGGEVRLYQFTDRAQAVRRAVLDESLVPYDTLLAQPPGWQYVLKVSTHTADITSLTLPSRLKLLAVGDAAGEVSVVDLVQPQRLFVTRPLQQGGGGGERQAAGAAGGAGVSTGIARLAVGPCILTTPGEGLPMENVVLFAAGEDSSLTLLSLLDGQPAGRPMRPKNGSKPLDLQLLDHQGLPLAAMQGACTLPWADNNSVAPPRSLQMMGVSGFHTASAVDRYPPPDLALSQQGASNSLEVQPLPSDDEEELDAQLAAAAAAAEKAAGSSKARLRASFFRRKSSTSPTKVPPVTPPAPIHPETAPQSPAPVALVSAGAGEDRTGDADLDSLVIDTTPLFPQDPPSSAPVSAFVTGAHQGEVADYPYLDPDGDPPPPAMFVLLATADYLRVYAVESVRLGDRTTDRKARLDPPATFAASFMSLCGPGVVTLTPTGLLALHSVPNLDCLFSIPLEGPDALGAAWCPPATSNDATAAPPCACSLDGQVVLVGQGNELARVAVVRDCFLPVGAASTFNWELAKEAAKAARAESAGRRPSGGPSMGSGEVATGSDGSAASTPSGSRSRAGSFLTSVKGAATGLVDSASAAVQELDRVRTGALPPRELPSLRSLFETPITSLEALDLEDLPGNPASPEPQGAGPVPASPLVGEAHTPGGGSSSAVAAAMAAAPAAAAAAAGRAKDMAATAFHGAAHQGAKLKSMLPLGGRKSSDEGVRPGSASGDKATERDRRRELLGLHSPQRGGSTPEPSSRPAILRGMPSKAYSRSGKPQLQRRTASDIKRTYGNSKAQDARAVAERNRDLLAERGRKLKDMEERSAALQGGAQDFSTMAKELEEAFANKKWWQL